MLMLSSRNPKPQEPLISNRSEQKMIGETRCFCGKVVLDVLMVVDQRRRRKQPH
ncbi:hypothetical protein HanRHA438_Chr08g0350521 [Helianthus annuus]|nr:hypothetical protein HanHA89_Chr08g0297471 [Helianthus annuus]KAJ0897874.1 hypothetical protein HanRHA438_Chr08g0350521 [Helianthus annuus]